MNSHPHNRNLLKSRLYSHVATHPLPKRPSLLAWLTVLAMLLTTLTISGCVGLTSAGSPASKTPSTPYGTVTANATSFAFGSVMAGSSASQTLTLSNSGNASFTISAATISGAGFSVVGGMGSISIGAGQNHPYQIQFAPQTAGGVNGSIVIVSDAADSPYSISLSGTGMTTVSISAEPSSQSVTVGQTATFSVIATGTGSLSYQWKKNGAAIGGATSSSYTTPAVTMADNGAQFSVAVTDSTGTLTSNAGTLTVTPAPVAPSITTQPANKTVTAGQTATFSVTATGTATLTYQWSKNGSAIGGATSASYTTPATLASDSGAQFTVTVTNSVGNITSNPATLTVNVPPSISTQPAGQTVTAGQTASFSVVAAGTAPLTYQWKKNGAAISGATSASYTTPATSGADNNSQFTVTVTNVAGNITSNPATLTVNVPPSVTTQPASKTVVAGLTATFSVTAAGTAPLSYQWNKNGTAIGGATFASYTTPVTSTADSGTQFTVTVTNIAGNITSNPATLTVNAATFLLNTNVTSLAFGNVNIGSGSTLPVIFTNAGNSSVTVSNVAISGAGYTASGVSTGQILTPGQTATLNVTFTPSTATPVPGTVTVTSNATNSPANISMTGTGVVPTPHTVALSWTASTSTVSGYNVYVSPVSGGPNYTKINSSLVTTTQYTDANVTSGNSYYYVVRAVDSSNVESLNSNEASASIP